jgi:hypothetical protein
MHINRDVGMVQTLLFANINCASHWTELWTQSWVTLDKAIDEILSNTGQSHGWNPESHWTKPLMKSWVTLDKAMDEILSHNGQSHGWNPESQWTKPLMKSWVTMDKAMDEILSHTGQSHGWNPETALFRDFQEKAVSSLQGPTAPSYPPPPPQLSAALRPYNLLPRVINLTPQYNISLQC